MSEQANQDVIALLKRMQLKLDSLEEKIDALTRQSKSRALPGARPSSGSRKEFGDTVKVYETRFNPMLYAFSEEKVQTAMKLVVVGEEERVVGCHLMA